MRGGARKAWIRVQGGCRVAQREQRGHRAVQGALGCTRWHGAQGVKRGHRLPKMHSEIPVQQKVTRGLAQTSQFDKSCDDLA